jgi:protein-S-isoprenylcysteine O-methyltransferase Ste14
VLIYLAFSILTQHWLPLLIQGLFIAMIFVPNMLKKDKSLSRYPEFAEYKENSGLFFPKLFNSRISQEEETTA